MRWLDRIPWSVLLLAAILLGTAPVRPEPHLWQKLKMLAGGTLVRPIDIFDLFMHGAPIVLLVLKVVRAAVPRRGGAPPGGGRASA